MKALISMPPRKPAPLESLALAKYKATVLNRTVDDIAAKMGSRDDVLTLTRSAIAPGDTATSGWAAELVATAYGSYLASLPGSAAARLIGMGLTVPMQVGKEQFNAPTRNTAPTALPWVAEADPIPVRSFDFADLTLTPKKMASISVLSRELAKRSGGEAVVRALLREDGEYSLDAAYFSADAVSTSTHAGLLAGISGGVGYAGGDLTAFQTDVSAILATIGPRNSGSIVFITGMAAAERIALKFPNFKSPVLASQALSDTRLIGIDAGSLVHSFGSFDVDVATDAIVHMSDEPLPISDSGVADPTRSLFQTDSVAIRIIGDLAFGARKSSAVAFVDGVTW